MGNIRAIVKRADEQYGHVTWISNTLSNLQNQVGGYIECVTSADGNFVIICDEEGRLKNPPQPKEQPADNAEDEDDGFDF